jgi:iron complex outermembrane receptor protein
MKLIRNACLASAVALAAPAYAQDASQNTGNTEAPSPGDIIVTATRQSTLLSKTPIALTALTGDSLRSKGIVSPTALGDNVPNLSIDRTNGLQITIRGVTSTDGTEKGDPSAAFLLDGVYIARPQQADVSFFDINRVEVLRGPQGTLYGRNTTAGVVNVISNKPELGKFGFGANAGYGNYSAYNVDGFVNVPAGENVAFRAAASFDQRDNYIKALPGDTQSINPFRKNFAGRLQMFARIGDNIDITLRGDYAKLRGSRVTSVRASNFYNFALIDSAGNPAYIGSNSSADALLTRSSIATPIPSAAFGLGDTSTTNPSTNNHTWAVEGELNWDLGPAKLTYIGSYRRYVAHENQLFDVGAPVAFASTFDGKYKAVSQELRLATEVGKLKLQTGLYYFREQSGIAFILLNSPFVARPAPKTGFFPIFGFPQDPTISQSKAAYAQGTFSLSDTVRFSLGGRFTDDAKSRFGHTIIQEALTYNPATDTRLQNAASINSITHTKFTWRAGMEADVARGLAYATVSTGYKAGGFGDGCLAGTTTNGELCNQPRDPSVLFYQPETLTAYEVGYKARISSELRFSLSAFHYDYKNLQLSQIALVSGAPSTVTLNAGKAKVSGVEAEATITPDSRNRFDLSYNYLDAHYSAYCPKGLATGSTTVCSGPDFAGRSLDRSPKHVATAGYSYTQPLANGASIVAGVRTRLSSSYVITNFGAATQYRQPSYTKTDVTLTYTAQDDRFYLQGFARNLENTIVVTNVDGFANANPGDPRTYGVRAGFKF